MRQSFTMRTYHLITKASIMSLTSKLPLIAEYLIANLTRYVPPPKVCQEYLIFYLAVYTWSISSLLSFLQYLSTKALNKFLINFNFMFFFIKKILLHMILNLEFGKSMHTTGTCIWKISGYTTYTLGPSHLLFLKLLYVSSCPIMARK